MNIFLALLEGRKFNQLKTGRGYIIESLPVRPPLIKTLFKIQSLQKFVDTNLTQWVHCYLNNSTALKGKLCGPWLMDGLLHLNHHNLRGKLAAASLCV